MQEYASNDMISSAPIYMYMTLVLALEAKKIPATDSVAGPPWYSSLLITDYNDNPCFGNKIAPKINAL